MNFWQFLAKVITTVLLITSTICPSGIIAKNVDMKITVEPEETQQTVTGWGTSACWWSQNVSDAKTRTELAKLLFSKEGLGLNIYRYNVGGGVNPEHNRVGNPWRSTESFYYYNEESGKYEYDFTRDANAQAFLDEALSYGCIDTVVLFANSPHYSMTISEEASGSTQAGGVTNMSSEHYQDFVDYFLTITEYFIDKGVPVKYISPINEPQWDWGGDWVGQEGCHYEPEQVYEVLALFSKGIDERGLDVKISGPESGEISDVTKNYFKTIAGDSEKFKNVGSLAYHSYWADPDAGLKSDFGKWLSKQNFGDKTIDMTEWCELPCANHVDSIESAVIMARVISNDMQLTGANSWTSWVAVNQAGIGEDGLNYSDGLLYANDDFSEYDIAERYYALAHYSKFVPAGSVVVKSTSNKNTVYDYTYSAGNKKIIKTLKTDYCTFKTPEGKIVMVVVNEDKAKDIKFDVSAEFMEVYTTDSEHKLENTYSGEYQSKISVAENSITTIVFG
ncbi:MAG: hypothetical protein NC122_05520 [Faecalibacterium sp.]|nr:hypothetical protein [Ruminococcus sp.]MCM1392896.1 hypothetical protein [Ruminococcus sp.]MCM1485647.1 hypothetical protein [Faecalibacterium sp.]